MARSNKSTRHGARLLRGLATFFVGVGLCLGSWMLLHAASPFTRDWTPTLSDTGTSGQALLRPKAAPKPLERSVEGGVARSSREPEATGALGRMVLPRP